MSDSMTKGVNTTRTGIETHSLTGYEPGDDNSAGSSLSFPDTSKKLARQIKEATDSLSKLLEHLCDLDEEFRQAAPKRKEEH